MDSKFLEILISVMVTLNLGVLGFLVSKINSIDSKLDKKVDCNLCEERMRRLENIIHEICSNKAKEHDEIFDRLRMLEIGGKPFGIEKS